MESSSFSFKLLCLLGDALPKASAVPNSSLFSNYFSPPLVADSNALTTAAFVPISVAPFDRNRQTLSNSLVGEHAFTRRNEPSAQVNCKVFVLQCFS
jgi:hypothetical protein